MAIDPRTPVLVGTGQVNQRTSADTPFSEIPEPVDLMERAARLAAEDAGAVDLLAAIDTVSVANIFSWKYRDPGALLGERLGAAPKRTFYTGPSGNSPQLLVNHAAADILSGDADVVLIGGAEMWRSRNKMMATGVQPPWTTQDESIAEPTILGGRMDQVGAAETAIGLISPGHVYPLFEQAIRIANGASMAEHRAAISRLWQRFNAVAVNNTHAWSNDAYTAEEIAAPGPDNRWISSPYTKLMNSNNMVEQGAVVLLTSVETAGRLGIPKDRWIFPLAGAHANDTFALSEREELHRSPAIRLAGKKVFNLAGLGADDIGLIDIYSCFPSAVQVAATELGLAVDDPTRPLTVTGGLTFAGGPWCNYVTHAIGTMAERLRERPGAKGLITANGGYLTKHALGIYGTEPPASGFRYEDVQTQVDREPKTEAADGYSGEATVEAWTVNYGRDGSPFQTFVSVRTPKGARTFAKIDDREAAAEIVDTDIAGASIEVSADGSARLT
ncbi:acetyl-CoA acetyltransferase [Mycobacterium sp. CBMA271]|uniref:acetyl-CoA acetyltransferase n=1 Tax=unclassified Mycobacteroides TaxID=2618759 RepID=UPI0012DDB5C3|nr:MULTISPECIES: acetyl-CoA acetyltransferase [unclassified Mycobacteroides]MUM18240.1 acetyl-CoA acetyltransferase [Mycobacteroides sp. CBMA 326]MUM20827.1 acetyl-CoA acetyltransferase [Mycobacteroides sp. CBMA 271]